MRNLRNVRFDRWGQADITATCWDPEGDEIIGTAGPTETGAVQLLRFREGSDARQITAWDCPSPSPDLPVDKVLSLQHLSGTGQTCIVFEGGDIVLVTEQDIHGTPQIEIIGSIDSGIAAARWSPDEELLIVVTKEKNVIFMGSTFDPVTEVRMTAEDLKASKHVSVGWGKRETQFQGRGARAQRDPTIPEKVDQGLPSPHEDGRTTISWRGDGAFVAINSVESGERRVIRVYSREGELDSASEPVDGLESSISWRPSGNLIAGVQRLADRVDIIFFERNGLRHGQFTLRSTQNDVQSESSIKLEWNSDSTVLAVLLKDTAQLWTMGNYHWYLKQEIPLQAALSSFAWHSEKPLRLSVSTPNALMSAEYIFNVSRGSCRPPYDTGAVAVIDGNHVKFTAFRTANVPPPMSQFEIEVDSAVVDVAFGWDGLTMAVLHHKGVAVYDLPLKNGRSSKPTPKYSSAFASEDAPHTLVGVSAGTSDGLFTVSRVSEALDQRPGTIVSEHELLTVTETGFNTYPGSGQQLSTMGISCAEDQASFSIGQDRSGKLFTLTEKAIELLPVNFPIHLPWFEVIKIQDLEVAFGLTRSGHLYANNRQLVKNCTSFVLTPDHLIFTTNNHFVKYVHLVPSVDELDVPNDDPEADERCRSVERGSKLVTAMPTTMCIVLQMPRGNLETIYPRAMVLSGIRRCVDSKDYEKAFAYCRTQRVDMNILYDHNPEQFLANVALFIDQVKRISYIDLFLSSLKEEDVTQTMYQDTRRQRQPAAPSPASGTTSPTSKVNTVCDAVLQSLQSRKATNLQNIITAHVCKNPPALEDGLRLVAELRADSAAALAESAIEHICFLVDVNRLYDNALGLYDLELALLVAQQSQRDPREYLPFIQGLHKDDEGRRKFRIDDHLARREKALAHLQKLDAFDELCAYTQRHVLYHDALRLYRYDENRLRSLTGLYASYLESTSTYREAGLAYESLGNYAKATDCYRTAGSSCWEECLFAAQRQDPPVSGAAMNDLATALADALWESKEYASAAEIHLTYLGSPETAIKCLCKGYHFAHALRLVTTLSRPDLLPAVDTGLADALSSTTEFLADCKGQLLAQTPRIRELRIKAAEDPLAFYEGERPGGAAAGDIPDDVSIAASSRVSTSASLFTRYTGKAGSQGTLASGVSRATSKNRKREEKKRARGRKGTVYEEEYLVNSVRRLVERVGQTSSEVDRLVFALARRGMAERARAVEALLADVLEACGKAVEEVFPNAEPEKKTNTGEQGEPGVEGLGGEVWRPVGGDAVFQDWEAARMKKMEPPIVAKMKKLTLLGS